MITILGVGHVFDLGSSIRAAIEEARPQVVAVELDPIRFRALAGGSTRSGRGVYGLFGLAQRRIARQYGVRAGGEMLAAVHAARTVNAKVALIDVDSAEVVRRLMSEMGGREKVRFLVSAVTALFVRRKTVEKEVARYETNPSGFLDELARGYPTLKRVLLDERNEHMARELRSLDASSGDVVAVVGDGHVDGLAQALADRRPRVVRLRGIREEAGLSPPLTPPTGGGRADPPRQE